MNEIEGTPNEIKTEKLVADLKVVVRDAEELLRLTASEVGDKAREAREKLQAALERATTTCSRLEEQARQRARATVEAADEAFREHPYQTLGFAFGIGLICGIILNRR